MSVIKIKSFLANKSFYSFSINDSNLQLISLSFYSIVSH